MYYFHKNQKMWFLYLEIRRPVLHLIIYFVDFSLYFVNFTTMLFIEAPKWRMLILCIISMISVWMAFGPILKIALKKNITDCPGDRKLQKVPIPVLGGVAVFFGIIIGIGFFKTMFAYPSIFPIITSMVAMLYVGVTDDILCIKPWKRLLLEFGAALLIIYGNRFYITDFQDLWGIGKISPLLGIPLSVVTFAGIVNAINMIDGVDGLCSGFCIMILLFFGVLFFLAFDYSYAALAAVAIGSLIPFFIHNVVGFKSKMFLGDGGTMVMGTLISSMVFEMLSRDFAGNLQTITVNTLGIPLDFSLIAFSLAVLSIPVSDTLRVMFERIFHHRSPFSPDKTHLHHLFIQSGFSYIGTTVMEIILNLLVIAAFLVVWYSGCSASVQVYAVVAAALIADFGTAAVLRLASRNPDSFASRRIQLHGKRSHIERKGFWLVLQKLVDGNQ